MTVLPLTRKVLMHVEHDPSEQKIAYLCADHYFLACDCLMIDLDFGPTTESRCTICK